MAEMCRKLLPEATATTAVRGSLYLLTVWIVGTGVLTLYAKQKGANVFYFLGIDAYIWFGVGKLGMGICLIFFLFFRPEWFEIFS